MKNISKIIAAGTIALTSLVALPLNASASPIVNDSAIRTSFTSQHQKVEPYYSPDGYYNREDCARYGPWAFLVMTDNGWTSISQNSHQWYQANGYEHDYRCSVKNIQEKVGLAPDGNYDSKTKKAVISKQEKLGLVPDGIVGPKTIKALNLKQPE